MFLGDAVLWGRGFVGKTFWKKFSPHPFQKLFAQYIRTKFQAKYTDRRIAPARNGAPAPFSLSGDARTRFWGMRFCGENFLEKVFPTPLQELSAQYIRTKFQAKYADRAIALARNGAPAPFSLSGDARTRFLGEEVLWGKLFERKPYVGQAPQVIGCLRQLNAPTPLSKTFRTIYPH